jgi:hypothetical protein
MSSRRISYGIIVVFIALLTISIPASAQSLETKAVRLDVTTLSGSFLLDGQRTRGKNLLDVLREARPNGGTILNVFFHSNSTKIRDVEEVMATADKQGGFAEKHTFIRCYDSNRPAWCEITFGKPVVESK